MKRKNAARNALFTSILSLLLCVSMLMGTTFAWFTDSVTTGKNQIASGNLDVELYHCTGSTSVENSEWGLAFGIPAGYQPEKVGPDTDLFLNEDGESILWEPGVQVLENFRIVNEGSLALKYSFKLEIVNAAKTPAGKTLADILTVSADSFTYADNGVTQGTTMLEPVFLGDGWCFEGNLLPGQSFDFGVGLEWIPSDNDNEYNVTGGLSLELGLTLVATQYTYEKDGINGDQYDAGAEYPEIVTADEWDGTADTSWYNDTDTEFILTTAEQLAGLAELVDGGNTFAGKTVKLNSDLDLYAEDENGEPICFDPIGSYRKELIFEGTFDGQGHTIANMNQNTWALDNGYYYDDLGLGLFGAVENATIKNLVMDNASISGESGLCGTIAAVAGDNVTFENITVKNSDVADYQYYAGGIVGWAGNNDQFINCNIDASTTIGAQWGEFNNANGGIIGGADTESAILMKDCIVACRIDAYNDVTSAYEWYSYRRSGMLIGDTGAKDDPDGDKVGDAIAPNLTCENVTVIYGDWANYHYCQFTAQRYPWVRVEAGTSNSAYSNPRYGHPTDANGVEVVDENHVHNDDEKHNELIVFDQLYGGETGDRYCTYGTATHEGVTVIYNNK